MPPLDATPNVPTRLSQIFSSRISFGKSSIFGIFLDASSPTCPVVTKRFLWSSVSQVKKAFAASAALPEIWQACLPHSALITGICRCAFEMS